MNKTLKALIGQSKSKLKWRESYKELFSKKWSLNLNRSLNTSEFSWNEEDASLGIFCVTLEEVKSTFESFSKNTANPLCVKTPFGASGRNIMRFPDGLINENQLGRIQNLLKKQGGLIVEPWLERVADFSLHFEMQDKLKFVGVSRLINDEHGQYSSTLFGRYENALSEEELSYLHKTFNGGLVEYSKKLIPFLEAELKEYDYTGPLGIDSFLYRGRMGELKFRPVVEVNFRYTMGRVALAMEKMLAPGKCGLFKIFSILSEREGQSARNFVELKDKKILLNEQGKWEGGCCLLNEWHSEMKFPAAVAVADSFEECLSELS